MRKEENTQKSREGSTVMNYLGTPRMNEKWKFGEFEEEGKPRPGAGVESHWDSQTRTLWRRA